MTFLKKIDWVKWFIIVLGVWLFIYQHPYKILVTLLVIVPLITLIIHGVIGSRPGISTLFNGVLNNKSTFSPVTHIGIATMALGYRVFTDYDAENTFKLLGVGLVATFALILLLFATHKLAVSKDDSFNFIFFAPLLLFYAPTSMFAINCVHDNTEPHVYQVKVVDKSSSKSSRSDGTHHVKVTSWIPNAEPVGIEVSLDTYHDVEEGDLVNVHVRDGLFGVGWYYVEP
jgi:hypothetical protein